MLRFWSLVDRAPGDAECWEWRGSGSKNGWAVFRVGQSAVSAARLACLGSTGDLPLGGHLRRLCHNPVCVRPAHLVWILGRIMERRLAAESDGYLAVPGSENAIGNGAGSSPGGGRTPAQLPEGDAGWELPRTIIR